MAIDRPTQLRILQALSAKYPAPGGPDLVELKQSDPAWVRNTAYLAEHGLVRALMSEAIGAPPAVLHATITAAGLDFLADDGGLTSVLGVVTVRLDADTLRALIEDGIEASSEPPEEKSRLLAALRASGSEALQEATRRLVGAAMDQAPAALQLLRTVLSP